MWDKVNLTLIMKRWVSGTIYKQCLYTWVAPLFTRDLNKAEPSLWADCLFQPFTGRGISMSSTFHALGNNCIILHRLAKHYEGFTDFHFNCENVLELYDQTDFITWQEITTKLNVNSYQGFIDTVWWWSRKHGQKFSLQPTSITNTSLDAGLLRGLVFLKASPLSALLCSQPALMNACTGHG